jgi:hypothetical protein
LNLDLFRTLASEWRKEAAMLERRGLAREARMVESFAGDLERRLREWLDELLTLEGAAGEVGTTYDAIPLSAPFRKGKRGCTGRRDRRRGSAIGSKVISA